MRKKYFIRYIQALSYTQFPFEATENAVDGALSNLNSKEMPMKHN